MEMDFLRLPKRSDNAEKIDKVYLDNTGFGQLFRYNDGQIAA
jgi:hypothetical protein